MPRVHDELTSTDHIPPDIDPPESWGDGFDRREGFALRILDKYWMSVFVERSFSAGPADQRKNLLSRVDGVLARCISCVGEEWEVRSEPTSANRVGLVVYTAKGKALAAGTGMLSGAGSFHFHLDTLYDGMTNSSGVEYHVEGSASSTGEWEVTAGVSVEDPR
ncbi:hypothetical protein [Lentzea cavernae]|uniref:Uncharacterized protein n=1 Tax=Lentzea cavernae TaxID=2020703 RepID=A0ABQ3MHJ9_9PSEU|nr:hypothetical protein [Lentzea cavernae]GHH41553.1 hypothetical protein GCM10017774_36360 [Lentzea cavernae]